MCLPKIKKNGKSVNQTLIDIINQGEEKSIEFISRPEQEGSYKIALNVTPAKVLEQNPENNYIETVQNVDFPDLQIEIRSVPEEIVKDRECRITVTIRNTGPEPVQDPFDATLLFTPTRTGQTTVRAVIDHGGSIPESNETNNADTTNLEVRLLPPETIYQIAAASTLILLAAALLIKRR
ncbi:MAG: hypothetical protein JRJ69_07615 [Deltaproteobacteria bacterium]|nr:hypothetical protein [Deltaproteobacteria bacterium]